MSSEKPHEQGPGERVPLGGTRGREGVLPSGSRRWRNTGAEAQKFSAQRRGTPPRQAPFSELPVPRLTQRAFCSFAGCRGALPAAARPPRPVPIASPFPSMPFGGVNPCRMAQPTPAAERGHFSPPLAGPPRPRVWLSKGAGHRSRPAAGAAVPTPCDTDRGASARPGLDQPGPPAIPAAGRRERSSPSFIRSLGCSQRSEQLGVCNFPSLATAERELLKFGSSWFSHSCAS